MTAAEMERMCASTLSAVRAGYDTAGGISRRTGLSGAAVRKVVLALEAAGYVRVTRAGNGKSIRGVAPVREGVAW
jgi:DNA-binding MarR family transcriptional regulator